MILAGRGFLAALVVCWLASLAGYVASKNQAHWPYDVAALGLVCAVAGIGCLFAGGRTSPIVQGGVAASSTVWANTAGHSVTPQ